MNQQNQSKQSPPQNWILEESKNKVHMQGVHSPKTSSFYLEVLGEVLLVALLVVGNIFIFINEVYILLIATVTLLAIAVKSLIHSFTTIKTVYDFIIDANSIIISRKAPLVHEEKWEFPTKEYGHFYLVPVMHESRYIQESSVVQEEHYERFGYINNGEDVELLEDFLPEEKRFALDTIKHFAQEFTEQAQPMSA